jgi:hypothetical protein
MEFTAQHAPLAVLAFLGTAALLVLFILLLLFALATKRRSVAMASGAAATVLAAGYALTLLGVSLTSQEKTLAPRGWKYFCEMDCHIAYSIASVSSAAALGHELQQTHAQGQFVLVQLKVWFDPRTISPHRGNGPLMTSPRDILLVDAAGHRYPRSPRGEAAFARVYRAPAPLEQPLHAGESFTTSLAFDVPPDARGLRLLVTDSPDDWLPRVIIGHEDSFWHAKIYLALAS